MMMQYLFIYEHVATVVRGKFSFLVAKHSFFHFSRIMYVARFLKISVINLRLFLNVLDGSR
jgi:hypothetical protein